MELPTTQKEAMQMPDRSFLKEALPQLMRKLSPGAKPHWGKAPSAQHIVEHLSSIVYISRKELNIPQVVPEDKIEKARAFLWTDGKMMRKGTKAPLIGDLPPKLRYESLEKALEVVDENISAFYAYYSDDENKKLMHPAFGPLDLKDWERFHHIHFVHHLGQFGVLEADMSPDPPQPK